MGTGAPTTRLIFRRRPELPAAVPRRSNARPHGLPAHTRISDLLAVPGWLNLRCRHACCPLRRSRVWFAGLDQIQAWTLRCGAGVPPMVRGGDQAVTHRDLHSIRPLSRGPPIHRAPGLGRGAGLIPFNVQRGVGRLTPGRPAGRHRLAGLKPGLFPGDARPFLRALARCRTPWGRLQFLARCLTAGRAALIVTATEKRRREFPGRGSAQQQRRRCATAVGRSSFFAADQLSARSSLRCGLAPAGEVLGTKRHRGR